MIAMRSASAVIMLLATMALLLANVMVLVAMRDVTVVVDGEPVTITTFRSTVAEVLEELDIVLDHDDFVSADPSERVEDGSLVEIVNARTIRVMIDGSGRTLRAPVRTVGDVIEELGLADVARELWISDPVAAAFVGQVVEIRLPRGVSVAVDGAVHETTTHVLTVGEVLAELGIELGPADLIEPALETRLEDGTRISIARVTSETITIDEAIPFETVERGTDELFVGESRVVQDGTDGLKRHTYRLTRIDGEETDRELVESTVVTEPTSRIIEHGTKERPPPVVVSSPPPPGDGSQEGLATYYGCGDGFNGRPTASGEIFDDQAMTAAHLSLPFDTIVTVTSEVNGRSVTVRINDRGPAAHTGKIIDLSCAAMKELAGGLDGSHPVTITW